MTDLNQASTTAKNVASIRYAQSFDRSFPAPGPDRLCGDYLPFASRVFAGPMRGVARAYLRRYIPGMYEWIYCRTRHYDDLVEGALARGVNQVVILGAGYDTRGVRFAESLAAAEGLVFELDHPMTQGEKRACSTAHDQSRIRFVPIDFETTSVVDALAGTDFDPERPALFFYEGVLMYLEEAGVKATVEQVRRIAAPGSVLSFDYCSARSLDGSDTSLGARETYEHVKKKGEPLRWGLDREDVEPFLASLGLTVDEVRSPADFEAAYLSDESGTVLGRMTGHNSAVVARWAAG